MSPSRSCIFYTDNQIPDKLAEAVRKTITAANLPIVSSSLEPLDFGDNEVAPGPRGYKSMFQQILSCLERSTASVIFFLEHDVLYSPSHFDFIPPDDRFYYNNNWWKIFPDGRAVSWEADQVSGLVCYRQPALEWYRTRLATFDPLNFDRKFEPMSGEGSAKFMSEVPLIDIRHNRNLTYSKKSLDDFRKKDTAINFKSGGLADIPGWNVEELSGILSP